MEYMPDAAPQPSADERTIKRLANFMIRMFKLIVNDVIVGDTPPHRVPDRHSLHQ